MRKEKLMKIMMKINFIINSTVSLESTFYNNLIFDTFY